MATKKEVRTEVVGREWDDAFYTGIVEINLTYSDYAIGSIQVVYDSNGQQIQGNKHDAGVGFPKNAPIQLQSGESIMRVTGHTGPIAHREVVRSLTFHTSHKRKFGPYGFDEGTPFNLPIEDGRKVVGFKGVTDGVLIAIGVYSVPCN